MEKKGQGDIGQGDAGLRHNWILGSQFLLLQDTVLKVPSEGDIARTNQE